MDAIRSFTTTPGHTDVARDMGPTSNQKAPAHERPFKTALRVDHILARGVRTGGTVKFESHESDHWGLATTIEVDPGGSSPGASTSSAPTTVAVPPTTTAAAPSAAGAIQR